MAMTYEQAWAIYASHNAPVYWPASGDVAAAPGHAEAMSRAVRASVEALYRRLAAAEFASPPCEAPGYCSTACWKVQRHVEPKPPRWHESWKPPIPDRIRLKPEDPSMPPRHFFTVAAGVISPFTSKVDQLPPMPVDTSKELAHMRKRWDTSPRYEPPGAVAMSKDVKPTCRPGCGRRVSDEEGMAGDRADWHWDGIRLWCTELCRSNYEPQHRAAVPVLRPLQDECDRLMAIERSDPDDQPLTGEDAEYWHGLFIQARDMCIGMRREIAELKETIQALCGRGTELAESAETSRIERNDMEAKLAEAMELLRYVAAQSEHQHFHADIMEFLKP